jgi:hypothetical protein
MPDSPHATVDAARTDAPDPAQQPPAGNAHDTSSVPATIATDGAADNTAGSSPAPPDGPEGGMARVGRRLGGRRIAGGTAAAPLDPTGCDPRCDGHLLRVRIGG